MDPCSLSNHLKVQCDFCLGCLPFTVGWREPDLCTGTWESEELAFVLIES